MSSLDIKDDIYRMQKDCQRAIKKDLKDRHWIMVIDTLKCVGCDSCTVACKAENNTPPGVVYNIVIKKEEGVYPNVKQIFTPRPCMQCQSPPCTKVCPVKATWKGEDGVVRIDYNKCIGCRYCLTSCPYRARYADLGDFYTFKTPEKQLYEERPNYEYGKNWTREKGFLFFDKSPIGNARKCHFCLHRLEKGLLPACINTCIGKARYFGDMNDPESMVTELITQYRYFKLNEEFGTHPSVFYLS